uniref:Uncharacterized protein n=1 Tax=Alexandrium monilatum TaxID=311494 RepID=A0A7S4VD81_9DINO
MANRWGRALVICSLVRGLVASRAPLKLADNVQLLQVTAAGSDAQETATGVSAFLDNERVVCFEAPTRTLEATVATKKASPLGGLYNNTYGISGSACASHGYSFEGTQDECFPGIRTFYKSEVDVQRFKQMEKAALDGFIAAYSLTTDKATLMVACTCHPKSPMRVRNNLMCQLLSTAVVGSWIHANPLTNKTLVCDQGPFEYAARALATLKSSPLLPMHQYDQIAPIGCAKRGFPLMYGATDHCYPQLHMWTRTEQPMRNCPPGGLGEDNPDCDDWGVVESGKIEKALVADGRFENEFVKDKNLSSILSYWPACNCNSKSMVVMHERRVKGQKVCDPVETHSPVRDFWTG